MRTHFVVQQRQDIRRDFAERVFLARWSEQNPAMTEVWKMVAGWNYIFLANICKFRRPFDTVYLEDRCDVSDCCYEQQEQGARWVLVHEKKHQLRKYQDTTNSLLMRNILSTSPGLTTRFLFSLTWGRSSRRTVWPDEGLVHHQDWQAGQRPQGKGKMGTERFPSLTEGLPTDRFSGFHKTRISDELPDGNQQRLGSFSHWSQNSFPSRAVAVLWCEPWSCVPTCHQKQVIHQILLQDWRNLHIAWTMPPDAGGTSLGTT